MKTIYILLVIMGASIAQAQPGTLDQSFGDAGKVIEVIGGNHATASFVAMQDDQKILVCGSVEGQDFDPTALLYRYMPDGTPDEAFGNNGHINIAYGNSDCYARSVAQLADGRIVVLVSLEGSAEESILLYAFEADGSPDFQFGQQGVALLTFGSTYLRGQAMLIQPDGKIVVAGYRGQDGSPVNWPLVARFTPDGQLDADFGDNGVAQTTIGDDYANLYAIALQPDGKIVAGGYCYIDHVESFAVIRFTAEGELDTSFDGDGKLTTTFPTGYADINAMVVQPDGKIVVAGYVQVADNNSEIAAVRFLADGSYDDAFNGDGIAVMSFSPNHDRARSVILQPDGYILISGNVQNGASVTTLNCALVRLTPAGIPDSAFHEDGLAQYNFGYSAESINEIVLQADGMIVGVGYVEHNEYNSMLIARMESGITVAVDDPIVAVDMLDCYPNPVLAELHLQYRLALEDKIQINLFDQAGRIVQSLLPVSDRSAGLHEETLQIPAEVTTGLYFIEIRGERSGNTTQCVFVAR